MKRYLIIKTIIALIVISTFGFYSCKKSFLDVELQGQISEDQALRDPNIARELVTATYNQLYQGGFGDNVLGIIYSMATDVASDDADKGSTPSDQAPQAVGFDNFTSDLNSNNFYVDRLWAGYYNGISTANHALDIL